MTTYCRQRRWLAYRWCYWSRSAHWKPSTRHSAIEQLCSYRPRYRLIWHDFICVSDKFIYIKSVCSNFL